MTSNGVHEGFLQVLKKKKTYFQVSSKLCEFSHFSHMCVFSGWKYTACLPRLWPDTKTSVDVVAENVFSKSETDSSAIATILSTVCFAACTFASGTNFIIFS